MRLETRKYLSDIQRAAGLVRRFTSGKSLAGYQQDDLLRSAVERQFEIIGEAMNKLAGTDENTARQITNFQRIIAFRNILIHGYADVDDGLVWDVVETYLPLLTREVNDLLEE